MSTTADSGPEDRAENPSENPSENPLGVRKDFPAVDHGTYLDCAYIGPCPRQVVEAGTTFLESKAVRPISLPRMVDKMEQVRNQFSRLAGASAEEIGFLSTCSEGENIVARSLGLRRGDNVVIDELHYLTTFVLYSRLSESLGVELRVAKQSRGAVDVGEFERLTDSKTRLISVSWVSHQNGFRHDLRPLADLAHANDAYLYVDGTQAAGMFPLELHEQGLDFFCSGTYKWLLAGYGVAPFYVRKSLLGRISEIYLGELHVEERRPGNRYRIYPTARKYEYATRAFAAIYQLGAALDYLEKVGFDRIEAHTCALAQSLRRELARQGYRVLTPPDNQSAIVAFEHGKDPAALEQRIADGGITVSYRENKTRIRLGIGLYNNDREIRRFLGLL